MTKAKLKAEPKAKPKTKVVRRSMVMCLVIDLECGHSVAKEMGYEERRPDIGDHMLCGLCGLRKQRAIVRWRGRGK